MSWLIKIRIIPKFSILRLILHRKSVAGFTQALELMENLENHQKSSMHGKIMEFEKKLNGKIIEFCEII